MSCSATFEVPDLASVSALLTGADVDVALVGRPFAPIGIGEQLRAAFRAFRSVGARVAVHDVYGQDASTDADLHQEFGSHLTDRLSPSLNIFHVDGNEIAEAIRRLRPSLPSTSYNIVWPMWELGRYPSEWARDVARFHEVWVASRFTEESLRGTVSVPVSVMPIGIEPRPSRFLGRRYFGIPESAFVFLFVCDSPSFVERKNLFAALEAFRRLTRLRPAQDVRLVIRLSNASQRLSDHRRVLDAIAAANDCVIAIDRVMTDDEIENLLRCCDCFVSLHRSEAFGMSLAKAMYFRKPVVATGYSGNLEFMSAETSCLIPYGLVPVSAGGYPHAEGQVWAEPDIAAAVEAMVRLLDNRAYRRALGEAASRHLRVHFSYRAVGLRYLTRVAEIVSAVPPPRVTADTLRKCPAGGRPRIVVVSHNALFYGAQLLALTLARTLSEQLGYDVEIVLCGDGPLEAEFGRVGQVHDFFSSAATPKVRERIVRDLYERGARVALCNTSCVGDVVELLKSGGFTVVSMIHELPGLIREYGLETSCAKIARDADRVIFAADVVRRRFIELTDMAPEKAVVRPQGLLAPNRFAGRRSEARSEVRARLGLAEGVSIVLGMGPADRRKGIDLFVDVGLKLLGRLKDVAFVWVGHHVAGAFTTAQARVAEAGAESRFVFPGVVEKSDVFFAGADAFLMTSREDPFPLVVLHALEAELPVIGFEEGGGFVELLQRDCGILVDYLNTAAMAEALYRLLNSPAERQRLGARGREIISREFSFVDYARDLVQLVEPLRPRVSVIVPNYNYARHVPTRLRSILAQTYTPHEIIFLDDCSSDGSVEVAEAVLSESSIPFRVIRNGTNQGCYRQWLRGIREATGDLVWIAEADDDCAPTFVETLVPAFGQEGVVIAYSQSRQIGDENEELAPDYLAWTADVSPTKWCHAYVRGGRDEIRDSLAIKNTIPNVSAVLMRKPDLSEIEARLVTLRNAGDWLTYVHLLERGDVAFFPAALNFHRRHQRSITSGHRGSDHGPLNLMRETLFVQQHVAERHGLAPDVERKREAYLQATYEYLGLNADGPPSYRDHEGLRVVSAAVVG